jgi:polyhydroxyalkanoate synthesis regulator phasin
MSYIKVKNNNHLYRDTESNCIINTDKSEYEQYLARKQQKQSEVNKVDNLERDISTLRNEITEIKDMLRSLVNGN